MSDSGSILYYCEVFYDDNLVLATRQIEDALQVSDTIELIEIQKGNIEPIRYVFNKTYYDMNVKETDYSNYANERTV